MKIRYLIILFVVTILITYSTATLVERWLTINRGNITFAVYLENTVDSTVWTNGSAIDWGNIDVGTSKYVVVNCTNIGTEPFNVTVTAPTIHPNMTLYWAANNTLLNPTESVEADLVLTVYASHLHTPKTTPLPFEFPLYLNAIT